MKRDSIVHVVILAILAAIPFRDGFLYGKIVGAGPDVISTLWGMWWFQQEGLSAVFGKETHLVNFPQGAMGIVLSPVSAMVWSVLEPIVGIGRALAITNWVQIFGFAWGGMWFAGVCGVARPWTILTGIAILCTRFLVFSTGEASVVAIVALSLPIGFGQIVLAREKDFFSKHHVYVALCAIFLALENPYLAPVLPVFQFAHWLYPKTSNNPNISRIPWFLSCLISMVGILTIAHAYGAAANPNYPREVTGQEVKVFGRVWQIVDLPWARLKLWELVVPNDIAWTTSTNNAISATGGRYLGVIFTLISSMVWHTSFRTPIFLVIWGVGCFAIVIALGSEQYNLAFPFLFLNDIMDAIARPLTQPTRFLIVTILAFSVCIAHVLSMIDAQLPKILATLPISRTKTIPIDATSEATSLVVEDCMPDATPLLETPLLDTQVDIVVSEDGAKQPVIVQPVIVQSDDTVQHDTDQHNISLETDTKIDNDMENEKEIESIEKEIDKQMDAEPVSPMESYQPCWVAIGLTALMVVDGFAFGGLGLHPPTTAIPLIECTIPGNGAVLIWPEDGINGELGHSRLLQMQHEHPTPQMGIASWKTLGPSIMPSVKGAGFSLINIGRLWDEKRLMELGFTHVLVDQSEPVNPTVAVRVQPCGDFELLELQR